MVSKIVEVAKSTGHEVEQAPSSFVFVATYLPLRSYWNMLAFIRLSGKVEEQVRASRGAVRYALKTDIPHKRFWTLSVWSDREDMALFSRSEPHRSAMKKFYEWGTDKAAIAEWVSTDGRIDWAEAEKRLEEEPAFHYKLEGKRLVHAPGSKSVESE